MYKILIEYVASQENKKLLESLKPVKHKVHVLIVHNKKKYPQVKSLPCLIDNGRLTYGSDSIIKYTHSKSNTQAPTQVASTDIDSFWLKELKSEKTPDDEDVAADIRKRAMESALNRKGRTTPFTSRTPKPSAQPRPQAMSNIDNSSDSMGCSAVDIETDPIMKEFWANQGV